MYKENLMKNLKIARKKNKMTQQYVADVLNLSQSNITKYENGRLDINVEILGQLAELYNVSTDWLLGIKKTK